MLILADFWPVIFKAMFIYTGVLLVIAICAFWFVARVLHKDIVLMAYGLCALIVVTAPIALFIGFTNGWFAPLLFHLPF